MGFSHVNKLISQGLYYLKKVPEILTENVSSSMRSKLAKIIFDTSKNFAFINKILLEKEGSLKAIAALGVESKNRNAKFINKKAYDNDTPILGVAIWLTDTLNEISQLLDVSKSFFPLYLDSATKCTLVIFLGVDEKYSNQGVEKVLVQEMLHPIKRENSEAVVVLLDKNNKKEQGAELLHLIRDNLLYAASGQSFIQSQDNEKEEINSELNPIIYGEEFSDVLLASGFDKVEPNSENIFHFDIFIKT